MIESVPGPRILRPNDAVLFLDFDGVLHPDAAFRTRRGIELRAPGELMMHAKTLENILLDLCAGQNPFSAPDAWRRFRCTGAL